MIDFFKKSFPSKEKEIIVLDVTRMREGRVCVAGVMKNEEGRYINVRPVPRWGNIRMENLSPAPGLAVEPFTIIKARLDECGIVPPHIEDKCYGENFSVASGKISRNQQEMILREITNNSFSEIFGENLVQHKFIYENMSGASLGCVKPDSVKGFSFSEKFGGLKIKFGFVFGEKELWYTVVDLRTYMYAMEFRSHDLSRKFTKEINDRLRLAESVYVRLGMSRPYRSEQDMDEDPRAKCYVQILSVHAFPDYLVGWKIPEEKYRKSRAEKTE